MVDLNTIVLVATVIGAPLSIYATYRAIRSSVKEQQKQRTDELQSKYVDGFADGQRQAAPTAELLKSQRDDARRERDNERVDRIAAENRVIVLEDELRRSRGAGT